MYNDRQLFDLLSLWTNKKQIKFYDWNSCWFGLISWPTRWFMAEFSILCFFFLLFFLVDNEEGVGRVSSVGVRMTWNWRVCKCNWVRELTLVLLKGLWLTFKQKFACINRITKKSCRQLEERQTEGQLSQIRNDSEVIYYIIF